MVFPEAQIFNIMYFTEFDMLYQTQVQDISIS